MDSEFSNESMLEKLAECQSYLHNLETTIDDNSMIENLTALQRVKVFMHLMGVPYVIEAREKYQNQIRARANGLDFDDVLMSPVTSKDAQIVDMSVSNLQDYNLKNLELMFHHSICILLLLIRMLSRIQDSMGTSSQSQSTHSVDRRVDSKECQMMDDNISNSDVPNPQQLLKCTRYLVNKLTTASLIMDQYPPQVLKTDAKFRASVRLGVGMAMGLHLIKPQVKCAILNEGQLKRFKNQDCIMNNNREECVWEFPDEKERSGTIRNSIGNLDSVTGQSTVLALTLNNMRISKIIRSPDRTRCALEEKFTLVFFTTFTVKVFDQVITLYAFAESLPSVVVVHDLQKCSAEGPILWDNAFYISNRLGFETLLETSWKDLAVHLQQKFIQLTSLDGRHRQLSPGQLTYLARMLLSTSYPKSDAEINSGGYDAQTVTYEMVFKKNLPGLSFGFWEWFWNAVRMIRDDIRDEWVDGLVIGFIDRCEAENLLQNANVGTFIIRFVEDKPGCICLDYIAYKNGKLLVKHPQPYTRTELSQKSLSLRLRDSPALSQLYPNKNKTVAFHKHWEREDDKYRRKNPLINGYDSRDGLG